MITAGALDTIERWGIPEPLSQSFAKRFLVVPDFLPGAAFADLCARIEALASAERSYVPTHKKGGTVASDVIWRHAPAVGRFYHSNEMRAFISPAVGADVRPVPSNDQNSVAVLIYDRPGDHIAWHYDHNFYRGRHFTALLAVVNTGYAAGGVSHAQLSAKIDGHVHRIETPPNTLVLFEGARLLHKVSPILEGERRVVISMTFCADPTASMLQGVARRIKDTAFFGIRALWT